MKIKPTLSSKQIFELAFSAIVIILFIIKGCAGINAPKAPNGAEKTAVAAADNKKSSVAAPDTLLQAAQHSDSVLNSLPPTPSVLKAESANGKAHRIYSVSDFDRAFPDINDIQLTTAKYHGIKPQTTRKGVKALCGNGLVRVAGNAYYTLDNLTHSSPYLVPRAQKLLSRIARNFMDSLYVKKLPPAMMIVTSVTRSLEDVDNLQTTNINATENSCHSYGTTFDISYNKYQSVRTLQGTEIQSARDDSLKWVLSEVLNDLRRAGACYVKYERKQGCFHITVR